ncbi:MAG: hypothetical protein WCN88_05550 [Candidatus Falkowbacteria bacterium]
MQKRSISELIERRDTIKGGCMSCGGNCWKSAAPDQLTKYLINHARDGNISGGEFGNHLVRMIQNDPAGGDFLRDLVGVIGDALPFIAPVLNVIPVVGPLLSTGAAALGSAARVGSEAWKRAEQLSSGKPLDIASALSKPSVAGIAKESLERAARVGLKGFEYATGKDGKPIPTTQQFASPITQKTLNPFYQSPEAPRKQYGNAYLQKVFNPQPKPKMAGKGAKRAKGRGVVDFVKKHKKKIVGAVGVAGTLAGLAGLASGAINSRDPDLLKHAYNPNVWRPYEMRALGSGRGTAGGEWFNWKEETADRRFM